MDIKTATVNELKALAYDCIRAIEQNQANLQAINGELNLREKEPKKKEK
jgi:hypothetical protein